MSSRGGIQVARQRIQVGFSHARKTVTIQPESFTLAGEGRWPAPLFTGAGAAAAVLDGDASVTDDDSVHMVQVRSGDYHVAHWAYSLYALQDLDLDAVDHGEGPADGAHVATIPAGLVAHHGAAQPVNQLGRRYVINQEIQVPGIDRQSVQGA